MQPLKDALEALYRRYNRLEWLSSDPLMFVHRYHRPGDLEIAGFLCSTLAYGRVGSIQSALEYLLEGIGPSPREFVERFDRRRAKFLNGFRYRFNTGEDLAALFVLFQGVLDRYGSLESCFLTGLRPEEADVLGVLERFCGGLLQDDARRSQKPAGRGLRYLLAGPSQGGASKRLHLFLRWMVRRDELDLGVWKGVGADRLLMPVDVHIARLTGLLGFHRRKTINVKTVLEITEAFRALCPQDPVRYDFALSRVGIVEGCTGRPGPECLSCPLRGLCFVSRPCEEKD